MDLKTLPSEPLKQCISPKQCILVNFEEDVSLKKLGQSEGPVTFVGDIKFLVA